MRPDEGGRHVVVDLGGDDAFVRLGIAVLQVFAGCIFAEYLDRVCRRGSVHRNVYVLLPFCSVADPRLEELLELGGLPALLVLLDVVVEFAPRALFDLIVGKAKLDVHFGSRIVTETTPLYKDGARTSLERLRRRRWPERGASHVSDQTR